MTDLETLSCEAERVVKTIGLPPCPAVLTKLVREARSDDPDFERLGELIGSDVGLAAALLKTVNSPFYGLSKKASSIHQAMLVMGLRNVTQLITGLLLRQAFAVGADSRMEEFWQYSSGIARLCACLAHSVRGVDRDVAYTFALFRDCGIPAMMSGFTDYEPGYARKSIPEGRLITEIEEEDFGIHHAYMSYHLAKEWLLPEAIFQAVLWHHDYPALEAGTADVPASGAKLVALALAAERAYWQHAAGKRCAEWDAHAQFGLNQLDMDPSDLDGLMPELAAALEEPV